MFGTYLLLDSESIALVFATLGCWAGYATAVLFARRAFVSRSLKPLGQRIIQAGFGVGVVAAIALEVVWSPNPKIYIPWGLFLWPLISFMLVGMLSTLWPNRSMQPTGEEQPAAD